MPYPTSDPLIQARGLVKRYGGKTVVDNLTFDVEPGRVTGFLGPNGADLPPTEEDHRRVLAVLHYLGVT